MSRRPRLRAELRPRRRRRLTALLIATALVSLVWTPEAPTRVRVALRLKGPLDAGLLGTDHFGRDVASMLMAGAWNSLAIAWPAVLLGAAIGTAIGCAAAAWKGLSDEIAMRVVRRGLRLSRRCSRRS